MRISNICNLTFQSIPMKLNQQGNKIFCSYNCKTKDNSTYQIELNELTEDNFSIEATRKDFDASISSESLTIEPENKILFVALMVTNKKDRGKGLGTCLHLSNIIELMENKYDVIKLKSLGEALPFHRKFGFEVAAPEFGGEIIQYLFKISKNREKPFSELRERANTTLFGLQGRKDKLQQANKIMNEYIDLVSKEIPKKEQEAYFPYSLKMELSKIDVYKNKDFYNKLFRKYDIDYQI